MLLILAACSNPTESRVQESAGTAPPTPVPTTAIEPTQTVIPTVRLWASTALPVPLLESALSVPQIAGLPVEWVDDPQLADVRLEPNPERPLTRWVYALTAPFPTIEDGLSLEDLRQAWTEGEPSLLVTEQMLNEMAPLLGNESSARLVPETDLLGAAWEARDGYSIVPFDELEPRWKVMRLNGSSPLDEAFDPESYALATTFGVSGDPATIDALIPELGWPASNRDPSKLSTVLMTGVSALVRATAWRMDRFGADYPGQKIGDIMRQADVAHVSHESAFAEDCPRPDPAQKSLRFCSSPRHLPLFEDLEVDVIELTGNHVADWGTPALLYTLDLYQEKGFETFAGGRDLEEARRPVTLEHNGNRVAFFGCNAAGPAFSWARDDRPGSLSCNDEGLWDRVRQFADDGYSVIFTFQWPEQEGARPLPQQVAAFRNAVESGAMIVNGSQAHRPQTMEFYQDGFIHYGLGNLFFDQMHALPLRQEFLDRHTFYEGRHISTELITAMLEDWAQPRPTTEAERSALLQEIFGLSGW